MLPRHTFSLVRPNPELGALENLEWKFQKAFVLYGARIAVRTNNADALDALARAFPPHWRESSSARADWLYSLQIAPPTRSGRRPFHTLHANAEQIARSRDLRAVIDSFERDMQLAVAQAARGKVFVHAGVVGWRGRAVIIPGRTYTGKSTLTHALVRAGATYYSDEYAVLDAKGRVHPFARHLSLRDENKINQKMSFEELGGVVGTKPIPVGTILVAKYREGAKWRPQVLSPGLGTLELLGNCVTARSGDPLMLEILSRVAQNARILKGARGEAHAFAAQVMNSLP